MLAIERRNIIMSVLREDRHVVVGELAKKFNVSEETIRRDLDKLAQDGKVIKTYGGAVLAEEKESDLPFFVRKRANVEAKKKIAELVSQVVEDGDTIILDASSTAVFTVQRLKTKKDLTVITNSVEVLMELADIVGWRVISTGGTLKQNSSALIGTQAEDMLSGYHVNKAILSCSGVDKMYGFTDSNDFHAAVKRKMLSCATNKIFAVDSSKYGKCSLVSVCGFKNVDMVITEKEPDGEWKEIFSSNGIDCLYPREDL